MGVSERRVLRVIKRGTLREKESEGERERERKREREIHRTDANKRIVKKDEKSQQTWRYHMRRDRTRKDEIRKNERRKEKSCKDVPHVNFKVIERHHGIKQN